MMDWVDQETVQLLEETEEQELEQKVGGPVEKRLAPTTHLPAALWGASKAIRSIINSHLDA